MFAGKETGSVSMWSYFRGRPKSGRLQEQSVGNITVQPFLISVSEPMYEYAQPQLHKTSYDPHMSYPGTATHARHATTRLHRRLG
jgi:hypothetical protein